MVALFVFLNGRHLCIYPPVYNFTSTALKKQQPAVAV
jgi:hypothetical protein